VSAPTTVDHYYSEDGGGDSVMLEDDSGRIRLVGGILRNYFLVTGCIIAVMGTENVNGEFDVIDLKFADLPPQPERWALSKPSSSNGTTKKCSPKVKDEDVEMSDSTSSPSPSKKIAIVSGLEFSGTDTSYAMELNLLLEFLLGEALGPTAQAELSHISRLIIAGNSIAKPGSTDDTTTTTTTTDHKRAHTTKKYGYDSSSYNPLPSQLLDSFLSELLPTMPVTLLPGVQDPANASYPQQPIHSAMFPRARAYTSPPQPPTTVAGAGAAAIREQPGWFDPVTNPWEGEVEGWRVLGTGGQNLDDICKYVDSEDRLGMMEAMCRWRCSAPTAPDTLCEYLLLLLFSCTPSIEGVADQHVRGLSFPGRRAFRHEGVSASLLCWVPIRVWDQGHRGPRRADGTTAISAVVCGHARGRSGGYRDAGCIKGENHCLIIIMGGNKVYAGRATASRL
jgi:DNA polymerase delta subunit 2